MENKQLRQCKQQMVESQKGQVARPHRPEDLLRELVPVIKDKWSVCLREGGTSLLGSGSSDPTRQEFAQGKFESGIEDFHSVLDQTLVNLKCATETSQQASASARYIPGNLSHHHYISTNFIDTFLVIYSITRIYPLIFIDTFLVIYPITRIYPLIL
ncbi:uncharacterized protein LOC111699306 isoform X1 [Eurytemora carolleeae]|uniref:uncharacterized protein LOC111699306 isoform X1 n=1 Tax=Eurytemora carolleeae TaxID=1294199 RepID=UPI000C78BFEB|nr:uncharacterized protein LOC111699306 isoform X1 [Eurytemora carolleeae]|eukprot:XP_023325718.1 uncharacterized protein LOC111699306 isoform X1 [Eurytemora affinis]